MQIIWEVLGVKWWIKTPLLVFVGLGVSGRWKDHFGGKKGGQYSEIIELISDIKGYIFEKRYGSIRFSSLLSSSKAASKSYSEMNSSIVERN